MGTAAFERDAVVEIDGQKYRLLRKVSETCWQLEHTRRLASPSWSRRNCSECMPIANSDSRTTLEE